ncbi:MAG: bifunctional 3-deoxy-7-phosphoheptulonate synthase/chorismate mutase type II [Flavobacteriales bacterium]|nr:bifunctional 3-deoxy-7-phosphoheptulonate synthase/chorismate mutase type II [Flavobacteriales bacterium]
MEKQTSKLQTWISTGRGPILISGPCSAETEEQTLETAKRLALTGKVDYIRAGIWKPRTRPGSFEGVGVKGLPWMQKVKEETGLPVTVEVANASHVDLCLEFDIDMLWIGARSTVNPFVVQEIADALRGVDIPVLIKNPINADLALWSGSTERLIRSGLKRVGAIHRGFSNLGERFYRNRPQWQLAIAYRNELPEIPLICDPSHICGRRDTLQSVSQKAMDLDFDGLMLESHIDPDNAWSDAEQQITPEDLDRLISSIIVREPQLDDSSTHIVLDQLREKINHIDDELLGLLNNRMQVARDIGRFKKSKNMTILQKARWNEVIERGRGFAETHGISESFIIAYLRNLHEESISQQERVMNE